MPQIYVKYSRLPNLFQATALFRMNFIKAEPVNKALALKNGRITVCPEYGIKSGRDPVYPAGRDPVYVVRKIGYISDRNECLHNCLKNDLRVKRIPFKGEENTLQG